MKKIMILRYLTYINMIEVGCYLLIHLLVLNYIEPAMTSVVLLMVCGINIWLIGNRHFQIAKYVILFVNLIQISTSTFIWFDYKAGFALYYFIMIPIVFLLFDYSIKAERNIIVAVIMLVLVLFNSAQGIDFKIDRLIFNEATYSFLYHLASGVVLIAIAALTWMFAYDAHIKQVNLNNLANTDGLTGVLNRRRFFEIAKITYAKAKKTERPFTLLIFDIDHFKLINDTYGHPAGDDVLREVASVAKRMLRKDDVIARYGGEEFAILLNGASLKDGLRVGESIRYIIKEHMFRKGHKHNIQMTISIGVASMASDEGGFESILKAADKALYKAKEGGRDMVLSP